MLLRGNRIHRGATAAGRDVIVGTDFSCPHCGLYDQVQAVPAVRASGVSTVYGTNSYSGTGFTASGLVPVIGSAATEQTRVSNLARELSPEPVLRGSGKSVWIGLMLLVPAVSSVLVALAAIYEPGRTSSIPSLIATSTVLTLALATPSLLLFTTAARRARLAGRVARGRPAAYRLWNAGKYCHRCGCCFWPNMLGRTAPARHPLSPSQFRWIVWSAGGYADA